MNGECVPNKRSRQDCCTKDRLCGLSMFLSVCLLLCLVCLAFFSYFLFVHPNESEFCADPQCIHSAAEINAFVDDQIDMCTDFHAFVCDKFMETAYEQQLNSPLSAELDRVENKIDKYIFEPESIDDEQLVIAQKRYFQACLDEDDTDQKNKIYFLSLLNHIGGWPILKKDSWRTQDFDWMEAMVIAKRHGLPFDWFLDVDIYDTGNFYYLKISRPKDCENFKGNPEDKYINVIAQIIGDFIGPDVSVGKVWDIVNFEKNLSQICAQMKHEIVTKARIFDLQNERFCPGNMTCTNFIDDISGQTRHWHISSEVFYDRDYIFRLKKLLARTDKEIQANYIGWKITQSFAPYLSQSIREAYQQFTDEYTDRFQFCLTDTKSRFHLVSEIMYIRENIDPPIVEAGINLASSIRNELVDEIKNIEWMSNETKKHHLNVYENLEMTIGGPEKIFEKDFFRQFPDIGQLRFSSYDIIRMLCDWSQVRFSAKMAQIGKEPKFDFNSEYIESTDLIFNEDGIYLPAWMLHGSTFDLDRPNYLNYASLGTLIARKLVEGLIPTKPAADDYYHRYAKNQQCLLNSKTFTFDDNAQFIFVDSFSRHIAYSAYQKYVEENGEELELAGAPYTPNQLFWIKSTTNLCYKKLPNEDDANNTAALVEVTYRNSLLQSVKNSLSFGKDFDCEEDTPMNPSEKCSFF